MKEFDTFLNQKTVEVTKKVTLFIHIFVKVLDFICLALYLSQPIEYPPIV